MFRNRGLQVVWNKILRNSPIVFQCVDNAGNKTWQLLVKEYFCIYTAAEAKCRSKHMNFVYLAGCRIRQQFRLVADPVNIHPLSWDSFDWHRYGILSEIFSQKISVELVEL